MDAMERFLETYPGIGRLLISLLFLGLLSVVLAYGKQVIQNNTRALEKLTCVLETVVTRVNGHDVTLAEHELRIDQLEDE